MVVQAVFTRAKALSAQLCEFTCSLGIMSCVAQSIRMSCKQQTDSALMTPLCETIPCDSLPHSEVQMCAMGSAIQPSVSQTIYLAYLQKE